MVLAPAAPLQWRTARGAVRLTRPIVVGILNVTPDSFHDGGRHADPEAALRHAAAMLAAGADILDIGGESTRPGAAPVDTATELRRVMPIIDALAARWPDVPLSVDTVKADVAREALAAGAAIVNDVSGLRLDPEIAGVAADAGAGLILMHSRGTVASMARYELADYGPDCVADVRSELATSIALARARGVGDDAIVVDPGLGFAKTTAHSLAVLAGLARLDELGCPIMVGPSRKRFIGEASGDVGVDDRLEGTIAACVIAALNGARLFRVHDVAAARRALDLTAAVQAATRASPVGAAG
jgi:dihydropteroate synthase